MGIPTFFILVLFLKFFQFFSVSFLFFSYFFKKSPQSLEACTLAPFLGVSPHIITSGLLTDGRSISIKITSKISKNGGDL